GRLAPGGGAGGGRAAGRSAPGRGADRGRRRGGRQTGQAARQRRPQLRLAKAHGSGGGGARIAQGGGAMTVIAVHADALLDPATGDTVRGGITVLIEDGRIAR